MNQSTLLGLEAKGIQAWAQMGQAIRVANQAGKITAVSSVIRQVAPIHRPAHLDVDEPEILRAVVKLEVDLEPRDLIIQIKTSTPLSDDISTFTILLLRYKQLFSMTPELTIPHPQLISEPRWLIAASEIDPDWIHPVLGKSLEELAAPLRFSSLYDFYAQGQTLLAFLDSKT